MSSRNPVRRATNVIRGLSNRAIVYSAMGVNLAFGIAMGVTLLGVDPFLTSVGTWLYLILTTIFVGGYVSGFLNHAHCLPGNEGLKTLGFVGGVVFLTYVVVLALTGVPTIIEPLSVGPNIGYSVLASVVVLSTVVFLDAVATPQ